MIRMNLARLWAGLHYGDESVAEANFCVAREALLNATLLLAGENTRERGKNDDRCVTMLH